MEMLKILRPDNLSIILLLFVRMTSFFMVAPMFGRRNVPLIVKIGFSIFLTIVLYNTIDSSGIIKEDNIYYYTFLILKEIIVGLILGFVSFAMFTAIYVAGQLIDMQIGFGVVNVIDPISSMQVPITSNLYFIFTMVVFLALKGHHLLIKALLMSYQYIPLGSSSFDDNLINDIVRIFGNIFILGFKIAAPVTASVLIADIALGVISRTIPQFNVFIVGMPLKIALGITLMLITIPMFIDIITTLFSEIDKEMLILIKGMMDGS